MEKFIPLSVPNFVGKELDYVTDVVKRAWVSTSGKEIDRFEKEFSKYLRVDNAVACQSGTAGLHLCYQLSGIREGNEVIVPNLTFIASVNPIKYLRAEPIFMDCDDTLNMDISKLEDFVYNHCTYNGSNLINNKSNKVIKAIVIVHVFGNLMDLEKVMTIAKENNLLVIEDATEALGGYYTEGKYIGKYAGTIGDFGVFSFNGNKIITTGGGGMIVSKHQDLLKKAKYLSTQAKDDEINFIHNEIGYNYRMTNIQAALGLAQLESLDYFVDIKNKNFDYYIKKLEPVNDMKLMNFNSLARHNKWFYSLLIDVDRLGLPIDKIINYLSTQGIQSRPIWELTCRQKPYVYNQSFEIEKSVYFHERIINLPCSTNLKYEDIDYIVEALSRIKELD